MIVDPRDYPALSAFLSGYLHQDFAVAHKTPSGAARAFHRDANGRERADLKREAARFLAATRGYSLKEIGGAVASLGGAWRPSTRAAFERLLTSLSKRSPA